MKPYEIVELEQGTPEWLNLRYDYLTSSHVPALFDLSPYITKLGVFEEKVMRREVLDNRGKAVLFTRGHNAEAKAREYVEKELKITLKPTVMISTLHPVLMASLDGFNEKLNVIFEAKFVGREKLAQIRQGAIPPHHLCQVQTALLVSGARLCHYFATDPDGESHSVEIEPNPEYQQQIAHEAARFWNDHVLKGEPPELSARDYFYPEKDERFERLARLKDELDEVEARYSDARDAVVEAYKDHARVSCAGCKIIRNTRKGAINYAKIPELKGIDVEKYRKAPSVVVTVRFDQKVSASKAEVA